MKISVEQDLGIVYSPLDITSGIEITGNVPASQQYNLSDGGYEPDYTITYLSLKPWMHVTAKDDLTISADVAIVNPRWYALEDGVETEIMADDPDYGFDSATGQLLVKRNLQPNMPLTLRFEGEYLDSRTGKVYPMMATQTVVCDAVAMKPVLRLDMPEVNYYYPVREPNADVTVVARLGNADKEVDAAQRIFVWEIKRDDGSWTAVGDTAAYDGADLDREVEVSADCTSAVVHRDLMNERLDLRVRAKYDPYGDPASVTLDTSSPTATCSFLLQYPTLRGAILGSSRIPPGQTTIMPIGKVYDSEEIPNPANFFDLRWRVSTGVANGKVTYGDVVATGETPVISSNSIAQRYGGKVQLEIEPFDTWHVLADSDGAVITDSDGALILIR